MSSREQAEPAHTKTSAEVLHAVEQRQPGWGNLLYDHVIGAVEATLYRVLGRRGPDHDDLVQAVFEQLLKTLTQNRYERGCSLRTWSGAIACNVALNALRRQRTERRFFEPEGALATEPIAPSHADPERQTEVQRALELLRQELARLKPVHAQTLLLHDALGHELTEIALITKTSVSATQSRLVRSRLELRYRMAALGFTGSKPQGTP